jgi:K+-sensing histidine kinase KdpD
LVVAVVTSGLAGAARRRADEAERRRREADLTAEMARVLLGGSDLEASLRVVGQRIAKAIRALLLVPDRERDARPLRRSLVRGRRPHSA